MRATNKPRSLHKQGECLPRLIDKTFPNFVEQFHSTSASTPRQKTLVLNMTMRQYEKKFYKDEIELLLRRIQKISHVCQTQQKQIEKLNKDRDNENAEMYEKQNRSRSVNMGGIEGSEDQIGSNFIASRLKNHYLVQIDKMKIDNEKRLRQKSRQKQNKIKSLQFQHHCEIMQHRFQQQKLKRQNSELQSQISQLNKQIHNLQQIKTLPSDQHIKKQQPNSIYQIQSYKQQNALLRSFIYKVQITQQKLSKIQKQRKKQREQYIIFAQESEAQKRQLFKDLQNMKNAYEQKIQLLQSGYKDIIKEKESIVKELQLRIQGLVKNNQETVKKEQHKYVYGNGETLGQGRMQRTQRVQGKNGVGENGVANRQQMYILQIERLRVQRNSIGVSNANLIIRLRQVQQQLQKIVEQNKHTKQTLKAQLPLTINTNNQQKQLSKSILLHSKLSQFNIAEVQSKIQQNSMRQSFTKLVQMHDRIIQLQALLQKQQQTNKQLTNNIQVLQQQNRALQNSKKLDKEISEHSYRELYQKNMYNVGQINQVKQMYDSVLGDNRKLREDIQFMNEKMKNVEVYYEGILRQNSQKQGQYQNTIAQLNKEIVMLRNQIDKLQNYLNQKQKEICERDNDVEREKQKNKQLKECVEQLNNAVKQLQDSLHQRSQSHSKQRQIRDKWTQAQAVIEFQQSINKNKQWHQEQNRLQMQTNLQNQYQHQLNELNKFIKVVELNQARLAKSQRSYQRARDGAIDGQRNLNRMEGTGLSQHSEFSQVVQRVGMGWVNNLINNYQQNAQNGKNAMKTQEVVAQQLQNRSQVYTIPDFSQQKPCQKGQIIENILQQSQPLTRNLTKQYQIITRKRKSSQALSDHPSSDSLKAVAITSNMNTDKRLQQNGIDYFNDENQKYQKKM